MRMVDRVMEAMLTGDPWDMARASYAYSRAHGVPILSAIRGAFEIWLDYRRRGDA